jgi:hypothetical protein
MAKRGRVQRSGHEHGTIACLAWQRRRAAPERTQLQTPPCDRARRRARGPLRAIACVRQLKPCGRRTSQGRPWRRERESRSGSCARRLERGPVRDEPCEYCITNWYKRRELFWRGVPYRGLARAVCRPCEACVCHSRSSWCRGVRSALTDARHYHCSRFLRTENPTLETEAADGADGETDASSQSVRSADSTTAKSGVSRCGGWLSARTLLADGCGHNHHFGPFCPPVQGT